MNKNVSVEKFIFPFDDIEELGDEILVIKGGTIDPVSPGDGSGVGCGCGCSS